MCYKAPCVWNPNRIQHLYLTSLLVECPATILMKGRGNSLKINCFGHTVRNTLNPLLSGQHAHQRRPHPQTSLGVSWCKHVLECIRTRLMEEENKEEAIFFCWRGFLFRDINAAKNKRTPRPDVFYWSRKREAERENKNSMGKEGNCLCLAFERKTLEDPKMHPNRQTLTDCCHSQTAVWLSDSVLSKACKLVQSDDWSCPVLHPLS